MYAATSGSQAMLSATISTHSTCPSASTRAAQVGGTLVVRFAPLVGARDGTVSGAAVGDRVSTTGATAGIGPRVGVDAGGGAEHPQAVAHIANSRGSPQAASGVSPISTAQTELVSWSGGQVGATVELAVASVGLAVGAGVAIGSGNVGASVMVASPSPLPESSSPSSSPDPSPSSSMVDGGVSVVKPCACHRSNQWFQSEPS